MTECNANEKSESQQELRLGDLAGNSYKNFELENIQSNDKTKIIKTHNAVQFKTNYLLPLIFLDTLEF